MFLVFMASELFLKEFNPNKNYNSERRDSKFYVHKLLTLRYKVITAEC